MAPGTCRNASLIAFCVATDAASSVLLSRKMPHAAWHVNTARTQASAGGGHAALLLLPALLRVSLMVMLLLLPCWVGCSTSSQGRMDAT
jgi:hypothetical protein